MSSSQRSAVVDLGSNSVRLVVFAGDGRNPEAVFNEKAVLRLGRGLQATGRLAEDGVRQAFVVMRRYDAVARAMGAGSPDVLATAAVRDAANGQDFVDALRSELPNASFRILTGAEEAALSADGLLCGIPDADGVLADIGGGSLELVRLDRGATGPAMTLPLGVIRLAERADGDLAHARVAADEELARVDWLPSVEGRHLFLIGGAWRAMARIHIAQIGYPLTIVHQYSIGYEQARELAGFIASAGRRALERIPGIPRRRIDDLPYAGVVLRRLLRAGGAGRVVFSASGMREGWYMRRLSRQTRSQDPLLAAVRHSADRHARDPALPPALIDWAAPLFAHPALGVDNERLGRLRAAACWLSDIGSGDHPEFRAEQAFLRVFRHPAMALDHHARAVLAYAVGVRYDLEPDAAVLAPARALLDAVSERHAELLGVALRLAYTLSGGAHALLAATSLTAAAGRLVLHLRSDAGVFEGESVARRLARLSQMLGLESVTQVVGAQAG